MTEVTKNKRGEYSTAIREANIEKITNYYRENLFCSQVECSKAVGVSRQTVSVIIKYLKELKLALDKD